LSQVSKFKPLRYRDIWLYVGYFWVAVTFFVCLSPNPPDTSSIQFGDKLVHLLGYVALFLWFSQIFHRDVHWLLVILLVLMGISIEFLQGFTEYRSFEVADMLANTLGAVIGWLLGGSFLSMFLVKLETLVLKN